MDTEPQDDIEMDAGASTLETTFQSDPAFLAGIKAFGANVDPSEPAEQ